MKMVTRSDTNLGIKKNQFHCFEVCLDKKKNPYRHKTQNPVKSKKNYCVNCLGITTLKDHYVVRTFYIHVGIKNQNTYTH